MLPGPIGIVKRYPSGAERRKNSTEKPSGPRSFSGRAKAEGYRGYRCIAFFRYTNDELAIWTLLRTRSRRSRQDHAPQSHTINRRGRWLPRVWAQRLMQSRADPLGRPLQSSICMVASLTGSGAGRRRGRIAMVLRGQGQHPDDLTFGGGCPGIRFCRARGRARKAG
jgi:hypothetical protein